MVNGYHNVKKSKERIVNLFLFYDINYKIKMLHIQMIPKFHPVFQNIFTSLKGMQ